LGSSHRAVQNASLAWGWLRMVRPYSSTLAQPSQAVFLPCMWGQLHAIYLYLQMKTILHYNDLQFEKQFVAKQNMDSNDSDCPTRPFLTREFRLRYRKRNTILSMAVGIFKKDTLRTHRTTPVAIDGYLGSRCAGS